MPLCEFLTSVQVLPVLSVNSCGGSNLSICVSCSAGALCANRLLSSPGFIAGAVGVGDLLLDAVYGRLDAVNGSGVVAYGSARTAVA